MHAHAQRGCSVHQHGGIHRPSSNPQDCEEQVPSITPRQDLTMTEVARLILGSRHNIGSYLGCVSAGVRARSRPQRTPLNRKSRAGTLGAGARGGCADGRLSKPSAFLLATPRFSQWKLWSRRCSRSLRIARDGVRGDHQRIPTIPVRIGVRHIGRIQSSGVAEQLVG